MSSSRTRFRDHLQRGYTLAEMMVVVAIVGLLTLITVPNFTAMYRASQLKGSLRQFASDLRGARARAVAHYSRVRVSFDEDARPGTYSIFEFPNNGTQWERLGNPRQLQQRIYFENVNFLDAVDADDLPDIVFRGDGTADVPGGDGKVKLRMDSEDDTTTFEVSVRTTGKVTTK